MEAELCIESCIQGHHVYKQTWTPSVSEEFTCKRDKSFEKCLTAFAGPCSVANFPIYALSSGVYSLYLPQPEVSSSSTRFTSAFVCSTCLSERKGTFVGYVGRSLVKYLYNAIFEASFTRTLTVVVRSFQTPPTK